MKRARQGAGYQVPGAQSVQICSRSGPGASDAAEGHAPEARGEGEEGGGTQAEYRDSAQDGAGSAIWAVSRVVTRRSEERSPTETQREGGGKGGQTQPRHGYLRWMTLCLGKDLSKAANGRRTGHLPHKAKAGEPENMSRVKEGSEGTAQLRNRGTPESLE